MITDFNKKSNYLKGNMRIKNLLFISDIVPYPPNTGIKIRTFNIIKQLSKEFNVYLIAFNHKIFLPKQEDIDNAIACLKPFCRDVNVLEIPSDKNKITYYLCLIKNLFSLKPYRVERYWSTECVDIIKNLSKSVKIDIIHFDKSELYEYSKFINNRPCVITNHNVESKLMKHRAKYEVSFIRRLYALIQYLKTAKYEKKTLNHAYAFITCTNDDFAFFRNKFKIHNCHAVIENGVDVHYYKPKLNCEGDYFLIIGAQSKESTANFDATQYFFDKIWPEIVRLLPDVKLKIVGRNPDKSIIEYGIRDKRINVLGFVKDERDLIEKSLGLLVPLRLGGGSRLKIITAMAMGKTVVSTTIGAEGIEYINNSNILIEDDPKLFAKKVVELYQDKDLRRRIGGNAIHLVQNVYDWNIIGNKINNFYQKILVSYEQNNH